MKKIIDLGKIGITLAGEYNDKATYEKLTIVLYKGKSYISTKTTQGVSPEEDIRSWQLVAEAKDAYHMLVDAGKTTLTEEEFLEQLEDVTKGRYIVQGNIINAADEEDLTIEHSSLLGIDTLKLANRPSTDGMGYVILRKNKPFASQVTKNNTIYEIRYNFNLGGAEAVIPEGCVLKFEGGFIANGTLDLNKVKIYGEGVLFNSDVVLKNLHEVKAEWIGIIPDIECTFFDWFAKQHLSIKFNKGTYNLKLADCELSSGTSLIGVAGLDNTRINITPSKEYKYLIGVGYNCVLRDLSIYIKSSAFPKKDLIRIDNAFWHGNNASISSNYGYELSNLFIDGGWCDTSINPTAYIDNGGTGIHIKTTQYNDSGDINSAFSLSWQQKISNVNIKFFKYGMHIEAKQEEGFGKVWQNCLSFTNITIAAVYGFFIEREHVEDSCGFMIYNYLFQALCINGDKTTSFGFYGDSMKADCVSNYISYDNQYLGKVNGNMYVNNATIFGTPKVDGTPDNYINGFIKYDNSKYLSISAIPKESNIKFIHDHYTHHKDNYSLIDCSIYNHIKWLPVGYTKSKFIENEFDENGQYHIETINNGSVRVINTIHYGERITKIHDAPTNRTYIGELIAPDTLTSSNKLLSVAKTYENYNFSHFIVAVVNNWYGANEDFMYEVTATIDMTPFAELPNALCFFSRLEGIGCEIISSKLPPKSNVLKVLVKVKKGSSAWISFDVKVSEFNYNNDTDIIATNVTVTRDVKNIGRSNGLYEQLPISELLPIGFSYYCTDKNNGCMLYWTGVKWVDATGADV